MAKQIKITSKAPKVIKVTSKSYPKVTAKELATKLGAEIVTDQEEVNEMKKNFCRRP